MRFIICLFISFSFISLPLLAEVIENNVGDFIYQLYKPDSYDPSKAYPLIIAFHESTGKGILMIDRFQEQAEKKGYLVALFTYYLGLNYPEKFRAIAPFGGPFTWIRNDLVLSYDKARQIPVLILQGVLDNVVNIEEARVAQKTLESFGYPVKLREIGGLNHEYPNHISWIIVNWFESN